MKGEQNPLSSLSWIAAINKTSLSLSIVSIVIFSFNPDSALQKVVLNTTSLGLIIKYNCLSS